MTSPYRTFVKLGSNNDLSKLELSTVLTKMDITNINFLEWKKYILIDSNQLNQDKLSKQLDYTGSIVKAGNIEFSEAITDLDAFSKKSEIHLEKIIQKVQFQKSRKLKISINIQTTSDQLKRSISKIIKRKILKVCKDLFIQPKILASKKDSSELSPFQYYKENMVKRGIEITCICIKSRIFFGYVQWVTNPLKDIKQDEERPVRLFTHGTSIKLSRTLVNISNISEKGVLLDPFCGTGTILQEGLKRGMDVIGLDNDPKCVRASKENLHFFTMQHPPKEKIKDRWSITLQDARNLSKIVQTEIQGIVTEPYLGPFIKQLPPKEIAKKTMKDLERLYTIVLQEGSKNLIQNGRIIIIMPEYIYPSKESIAPDFIRIGEKASLKLIMESKYFNVKLPLNIGRKHNIINRKLVVYWKNE